MRKSMQRRLASLCYGELISVVLFIPVSYLINRAAPELHLYKLVSFWCSFTLLLFLLLQGSYYWHSKLQRLKKEKTTKTPLTVVKFLYRMKKVNIILLVLAIIPFVIDITRYIDDLPKTGLGIVFGIYVFTILEYINYFHIQLSYDRLSEIKALLNRRKWKPSSLRKDFKRLKNMTP